MSATTSDGDEGKRSRGAMYEGFVHGLGVGYKGKVEMARAFTLVWSGKGIATLYGYR